MPTIADVRQQYPQYNDLSDADLAAALHRTYYNDMPKAEFDRKVGLSAQAPKAAPKTVASGALWPFSRDSEGNISFDSNAGVVGAIKRGVMAPSQAMSGEMPAYAFDPQTGRVGTSPQMLEGANALASIATPINPAARAGDMAIPGVKSAMRKADVKAPTRQALLDAGSQGYEKMRGMGVDYRVDAVKSLAETTRIKLNKQGISDTNAGPVFQTLNKLANPPDGAIATLDGLEQAVQELGKTAVGSDSKTVQFAARQARDELRAFIKAGDPSTVVAGPAIAAGKVLKDADKNYAAGKRSELLQGKGESAELDAIVANSGQNIDNRIRNVAKWVVHPEHPDRRAGFSKAELKLIEGVAKGNFGRNTVRGVGNLLGGGGGLGAAVVGMGAGAAGGYAGGPAGLAVGLGLPAVGFAAKQTGNALTRRAFTRADELVRKRNPLYQRMLQEAPMEAPDALQRAALMRALLLAQQGQS